MASTSTRQPLYSLLVGTTTLGRAVAPEEFRVHLIQVRPVRHIRDVHAAVQHVLPAGSGLLKHQIQIRQSLSGLRLYPSSGTFPVSGSMDSWPDMYST